MCVCQREWANEGHLYVREITRMCVCVAVCWREPSTSRVAASILCRLRGVYLYLSFFLALATPPRSPANAVCVFREGSRIRLVIASDQRLYIHTHPVSPLTHITCMYVSCTEELSCIYILFFFCPCGMWHVCVWCTTMDIDKDGTSI